jgi:hypothetical protein
MSRNWHYTIKMPGNNELEGNIVNVGTGLPQFLGDRGFLDKIKAIKGIPFFSKIR